jgi:hypothetical protein
MDEEIESSFMPRPAAAGIGAFLYRNFTNGLTQMFCNFTT